MNPLIRAGVAAIVALTAVPASAGPLAKIHGDGFTLLMPGGPQKTSSQISVGSGTIVTQSWTASDDNGVVYSASTADYPDAMTKRRSSAEFLQEARNGLAVQLNGTVILEKAVQLAGNSGTEFAISSENGHVKARSFMVGPRVYTLLVVYNPSVGAPDAQSFLTSLTLAP